MVLRFPVSGYPFTLQVKCKASAEPNLFELCRAEAFTRGCIHECNRKDTKKMAGLQDFSLKSCDFLLHLTLYLAK